MQREDVSFVVDGNRCAAWLYRPTSLSPYPIVVMAHGFAGTRELRLDSFAQRFAAAGMAVLVFDYRHFGDSEGQPRQLLDIQRQLDDWRAALRFARTLPEVDLDRIALWGTSFSGGHVLTLGAEGQAVAAIIAQVPFVDGLAIAKRTSPLLVARFAAAALRDLARRGAGRPPRYIPAVGEPGQFAAITSPDAARLMKEMIPPGVEWVNQVAAGITLQLATYRPGKHTRRIKCPVLFTIAEQDVLTPVPPVLAAASHAPHAEVRGYPAGHFDVYFGEMFERVVADQLDFLRRNLLRKGMPT